MRAAPRTYEEFKTDISELLAQGGPYAHNMISITLRLAAAELGRASSNRLVVECGLDRLGWSVEK